MTSRSALKSAKEIKIKLIRARVRARHVRPDVVAFLAQRVSVKGPIRRADCSVGTIPKRLGLLVNRWSSRENFIPSVSLGLSEPLLSDRR